MNFAWVLLLPFVFAAPPVNVRWERAGEPAVVVSVPAFDEKMEGCLSSGFELRYTMALRLCRRSPLWFDSCDDVRERIHLLKFDPIADQYTIILDTMKDSNPPERLSAPTLREALQTFSKVRHLALQTLTRRKVEEILGAQRRPYISVRVVCECRGERSRAVEAISTILTFGLVSLEHFDTGWNDFDLVR